MIDNFEQITLEIENIKAQLEAIQEQVNQLLNPTE
jgi:hypothetical protein